MSAAKVPIDEIWALAVYYLPSFTGCLVMSGIVGFAFPKTRQKCEKRWSAGVVFSLMLLPILFWLVYFGATVRNTYVLTSLDTEDDSLAELIYYTRFDVDLKTAIGLATDESEFSNVRFYACCRIADLLSIDNESIKTSVLKNTANAHPFQTEFFNTNRLTCGFFTPGYAEGPYTVNGVVEKRLEILAHSKSK